MHDEDVSFKGIAVFLGILAIILTAVYAILMAMWRDLEHHAQVADEQNFQQAPMVAAAGRPYFPFPHEQPNPIEDLTALRAREEEDLNTYGWINKTSGVVRIPINRAMGLLAEPAGGHP